MARYLVIESRDPFESRDSEEFLRMLFRLAERGDDVDLYLLQNGVLMLRKSTSLALNLRQLHGVNIEVMADDFSLRERGIESHELVDGVRISNIDELVRKMLDPGRKTFWH